jgi:predicted nucleic acid-binding Zn finger protein
MYHKMARISRHPEIWVYVGVSRDYVLVDRRYCSCPSFMYSVSKGESPGCKHLEGLPLVVSSGKYRDLTGSLGEKEAAEIVMEVLILGFSRKIRELIFLEK